MTITPRLSEEVEAALRAGGPVVALETTLVSHGFPGALGVQVALAAEARVRPRAPSRPRSGSSIAWSGSGSPWLSWNVSPARARRRASRPRDLAACVVQGGLGATTVGGTLAVCRLAGIAFMATGGTGGVHRGFAASLDISADLPQIARTRALVVPRG